VCILKKDRMTHYRNRFVRVEKGITYLSNSDIQDSIHLDRAWKHLILSDHEVYKDFCFKISGGYLDKPTPRTDNCKYKEISMNDLYESDSRFKVHNKYEDFDECSFDVLLSISQISDTKKYFSKIALANQENETFEISEVIQIIEDLKSSNDIKTFTFSEEAAEVLNIDISNAPKEVQKIFEAIIDMEMPEALFTFYKNKLMLDEDQVIIVIVEYAKFLILKALKPKETIPSMLLNLFWSKQSNHLEITCLGEHFTSTRHYRNTCENLF
jgi:hypothetical protein